MLPTEIRLLGNEQIITFKEAFIISTTCGLQLFAMARSKQQMYTVISDFHILRLR
jgi:hypothetical protein